MKRVMRLALITLCYVLASFITCLATLMLSGLIWLHGTVLSYSLRDIDLLVLGTVIAGTYGAPFAVPLIVRAQFLEKRSWTIFILGGAAIGAFMFVFMKLYPMAQQPPAYIFLPILVVSTGLAGAAYYFLEDQLLHRRRQTA